MPTVVLPELVRKYSPDTLKYTVSGETVYECMRDLADQCPSLRGKLFKETGELSAQFIMYLDGRDIRMLDKENTPVRADSEIRLLAALAGG